VPEIRRLRQAGWTALFAALAGALGVGVASHNLTLAGGAIFLVLLGWFAIYWRQGVMFLLVLSCVDGFIKYYYGTLGTYLLKDLVFAGVLAGVGFRIVREPRFLPKGRWLGLPFVVLYLAFDFAEILIPNGERATAVAGFRAHAMYGFLFFIGALYFDSLSRLVRTAIVSVAAIAFAASIGVLQYALGAAWLNLGRGFATASSHYIGGGGGDASTAYRAYGTMVDPTALGLACGLGMLYALGMLCVERSWLERLLLAAAFVVCAAALDYTGTRSAILGLAVGLVALTGLLAARRDSRRYIGIAIALTVCAGAIAVPFVFDSMGTAAQSRYSQESENYALATRQRSFDYVASNVGSKPLGFGLGVTGAGGRIRPEQFFFSVDNVYLTALYETGPPGFLLLLAVQGALLFLTARAAFRAVNRRLGIAYAAIAAGQVSLLVSGWYNQGAFDYAPMAQMFWLFAGAVAMPKRLEASAAAEPVPAKRAVPQLRALLRPIGDPRRIELVTRMRAPGAALAVKPATEADVEAAIAAFGARLRGRLLELARAGHWSQYSADELFGRAGRELFIDLKKALATLETDPFSREGADAVVGSSVEVAALMTMLADKFATEPPNEIS
jgi:hypothetical protein